MTRDRPSHRFTWAPALILALTAGGARESAPHVASPRAILFYGGPLLAPIVIEGRAETSLFLGALVPDRDKSGSDTTPNGGAKGPISIALFWSNRPFGPSEKDTLPIAAFHPFDSDQRGRLYASNGGKAALIVIHAGSGFPAVRKRMTDRAARMLTERGAPAALLLLR
jgi:hypothetical protein